MLQKALLLIPLLFVLSPELLATGPSYMEAGFQSLHISSFMFEGFLLQSKTT